MNTLRLVDEFEDSDFDDDVEKPGDVYLNKSQLNQEAEVVNESLQGETQTSNKFIKYDVNKGINISNTNNIKSPQDLIDLRDEINGFLESSKEISDAEDQFDKARQNPNVDPEDLMDMQTNIQDLKESEEDDPDEEKDLWTIVYAELAQDGADAAERQYLKSPLRTEKKNKYPHVDPVNDYDLRVYAADESGFELAKKVADYHKLESKIEPTNRIHATRFPQEKLQMTIFIPQDKIALK